MFISKWTIEGRKIHRYLRICLKLIELYVFFLLHFLPVIVVFYLSGWEKSLISFIVTTTKENWLVLSTCTQYNRVTKVRIYSDEKGIDKCQAPFRKVAFSDNWLNLNTKCNIPKFSPFLMNLPERRAIPATSDVGIMVGHHDIGT